LNGKLELARQGAAMTLIGPEPDRRIPRCSARDVIKNWTELRHCIAWKMYQVIDMVNFLLVDHARRQLIK
jgi:hypothetical protein